MRIYLLLIAISFMMVCHAIAPSDSVHEKDRETLKRQAMVARTNGMINGMEAFEEIVIKYHIPKGESENIRRLLTDRETRKFACNFTHKDSARERVLEKKRIDLLYRDSIDMILVAALGSKVTGDNINRILFHAKGMKLDSIQFGIIMDKALDMAHRLHDDPRIDMWDEEMKLISKTLNGKQQKLFFHLKNNTVVNRDKDAGWERLKNAGLTEQLDSAKETNLAYDYYHEMYRIKDLYRYHGTSQRKYLAELNKHKPMMVKMLDGLDKKAAVTEEEEKNGTVGKEFVW